MNDTTYNYNNSKLTSITSHNENKANDEVGSSIISEDDGKNFKPSHRRNESNDIGIHYVDDDDGVEFQLDQRYLNKVHEELEKLNIATDVINKLEVQLDEARKQFRLTQQKWSQKLDELSKKYGNVISKSRPYYEAKLQVSILKKIFFFYKDILLLSFFLLYKEKEKKINIYIFFLFV